MTEKDVKKSVCLSSSKDQAQNYDKSLGRESKVPNTVQSASLRTLAFCSHFLVFFFSHGIIFESTLNRIENGAYSKKKFLEKIYILSRGILDYLLE